MEQDLKKLWFIVGCLIFLGLALGGWYTLREHSFSAAISVQATPLSSVITLNGRSARQGVNKVRPGTYKILVIHEGFSDYASVINVARGNNKYVGAILEPSSSATSTWYSTHPTDQKIVESI